jgi:replicative superfamily II helicase
MGFIELDSSDLEFRATKLGQAVVGSALEPEHGVFVHCELQRALKAFVMDGEMHVLYSFTPIQDSGLDVNWQIFRKEMESLDESGLRVMSFLGLKPTIVNHMASGGSMKETNPQERDICRVYRRFYLALQLRDLCNEVPVHIVARKYDTPRGTVQNLAQTCQGFAAGMIKFCEKMDWRLVYEWPHGSSCIRLMVCVYSIMAAVLNHLSDRLQAGARDDLLALAQITFIKSSTARVFYDNGYKTVAAIANADPNELVPVLIQAQPTKVRLKSKDGERLGEKLLAKAKIISASANRVWRT